jgi:uncharacterized protein YcbX
MKKVGIIREIWKYPVKGMGGQKVSECHLGMKGLTGDRVWALRDTKRGEIQSCKMRPDLLRCKAQFKQQSEPPSQRHEVDIFMPDGTVISTQDPEVESVLSELVGHESTLEYLGSVDNQDFFRRYKKDQVQWLEELKATFEREPGEPLPDLDNLSDVLVDYITIPGTFFLVMPFHIVTTSTISHLKKLNPAADWRIERFRPNIVIETLPDIEGLVEQDWLGKKIFIGKSVVSCESSTPRCGAVTKKQQDLEQDTTLLRTIVKDAAQNLGVYSQTDTEGMIKVGDEVFISD